MNKQYKCCICHHKLERNNRLVHQIYNGFSKYGRFENENNYDFCDRCFEVFEKWINKHKKEVNENDTRRKKN